MRNKRDFKAALAIFTEARELFKDDKVFDHHISVCNRLMYQLDWDGVVRL
jgi:hypothetical protein